MSPWARELARRSRVHHSGVCSGEVSADEVGPTLDRQGK